VPAGFDATKDAYVAWLIEQVEAAGESVDIVGHDWGSLLVQRLVSLRPDLVRTWAVGSGPVESDYIWHDTAKIWQTERAGEQFMQAMTPELMTGALSQQGLDAAYARAVADKIDDLMKDCILKLYRSATRVAEEWAPLAAPVPPGLVIFGDGDPYVPPRFGRQLAERTGAKFVEFEN
jgi:pimeloyl-ACP methyl ester carboxylesterase